MILYLFIHFPFIWWFKIGFAHTSAVKRAAALDKSVFGLFIPVGILVVPFAYAIEQYFHRLCRRFRFRFYRADGSTETFWFPAALPVIAFMIFVWGVYCWAVGRMFGFDGFGWYVCFLRVLWGWVGIAFKTIISLFL